MCNRYTYACIFKCENSVCVCACVCACTIMYEVISIFMNTLYTFTHAHAHTYVYIHNILPIELNFSVTQNLKSERQC